MDTVVPIPAWAALGVACGTIGGCLIHRALRTTRLSYSIGAASVIATSLFFAIVAWRLNALLPLLVYSYLAAVLVALAAVDAAEQRLPSAVVLPSCVVLIVGLAADAVATSRYDGLERALVGMVLLAAAFLALAVAVGGLGAGDVKLAGLLGLALGWWGWTTLLIATFLGWLLAAIAFAGLRATGRTMRDQTMPLGPFLVAGTIAAIAINAPVSA